MYYYEVSRGGSSVAIRLFKASQLECDGAQLSPLTLPTDRH